MTREDYVKSLIKSNGCNLKEFAAKIHMPYTTLLSILNGSIGGAALDLTVEELNNIVAKSAPVRGQEADGIDPHLLELIRKLPMEKQLALKLLLADM